MVSLPGVGMSVGVGAVLTRILRNWSSRRGGSALFLQHGPNEGRNQNVSSRKSALYVGELPMSTILTIACGVWPESICFSGRNGQFPWMNPGRHWKSPWPVEDGPSAWWAVWRDTFAGTHFIACCCNAVAFLIRFIMERSFGRRTSFVATIRFLRTFVK